MVAVIIIQQAPYHHSPLPPRKKERKKENMETTLPDIKTVQNSLRKKPAPASPTRARRPRSERGLLPGQPPRSPGEPRHPDTRNVRVPPLPCGGRNEHRHLAPVPPPPPARAPGTEKAKIGFAPRLAKRLLLKGCRVVDGFCATPGILLWLQGGPGA